MTNLITLGSDVAMKAIGDNKRQVEGYLVLFGNPNEADFVGDYFTKDTDFDLDDGNGKATMYFNHGMDPVLKHHKLNHGMKAELSLKDKGVWVSGLLDEANEYDAMVIALIEARSSQGKSIGWSSGSASHLVKSVEVKSGIYEITKWPLGADASLTHTPADYRNKATYKTIEMLPINYRELPVTTAETEENAQAVQAKALKSEVSHDGSLVQISSRSNTMDKDENIQNVQPDDVSQVVDAKIKDAMSKLEGEQAEFRGEVKGMADTMAKLLDHMENSPTVRKSGYYTQDGGKADETVKSLGDFMMAVRRNDQERLAVVYKSGYYKAASGDSGAAGGYLIPEAFSNTLLQAVLRSSPIVNGVTRQSVSVRSGRYPSLDVTTAPTAGGGESAEQSGVGTNIRAEGGAYTEETPAFDQLLYNVSDYASGYVKASRELSQEVSGLESLFRNLMVRAYTEKVEKGILRGTGAAQPLGILNSSAAVAVTPDADNVFAYADAAEMASRFKAMAGLTSDNGTGGGAWLTHRSILPDIYNFEVGTGGSVWNANPSQGPTMVHDGRPIIFSEHLPQANNSGCVILADLASYILFELGGFYIDFSEHVDFLNGNDTWRYGARVDGKPWLNNAITLADPQGSFTVSPFVYFND